MIGTQNSQWLTLGFLVNAIVQTALTTQWIQTGPCRLWTREQARKTQQGVGVDEGIEQRAASLPHNSGAACGQLTVWP